MRSHFTLLKILLGIVMISIMAIAINRAIAQRNPVYEGRSLESWLASLDPNSVSKQDSASRAFDVLAEKSLPFLLAQVQADMPTLQARCQTWVNTKVFHKILALDCGRVGMSRSVKRSFALKYA